MNTSREFEKDLLKRGKKWAVGIWKVMDMLAGRSQSEARKCCPNLYR
jgi:hypothetical protein